MAAQRFLIPALLALILPGAAAAQTVAVPSWVRSSSKLGLATASAVRPGTKALENFDRGASAAAIVSTVKLAKNIPPLLTYNRRVLTNKPKVKPAGRGMAALTILAASYDLYNGTLTTRDAQIQATQYAASAVASTATFAGMVYLAGTIGTASTGTAIATLHGAAYASATAAWWGGGSLAAGGLGAAGGTMVMTGGAAIVAIGVGYGVYKAWNYFDPSERDATNMLVAGLLNREDLTDSSSSWGASIAANSRRLAEMTRLRTAALQRR